jgi:hypothetical protein
MRVVEPGQLVLREDRERLVGEVVRTLDVSLRVEREVCEQDECATLDVVPADRTCLGECLLRLLAHGGDVG